MKVAQPKSVKFRKTALAAAVTTAVTMGATPSVFAQDEAIEEIIVAGIRGSLVRGMDVKRNATGVVDSIAQEDVGKFPDLNVAESLQRITGVSIDRSGGEGQQVTVRGLGPQFNTVLVNGRQIATDSPGREFNFDMLSSDLITGADVFKTTQSNLQEGGIGATINVKTARPFDNPGLQIVGSLKGMYESLSEETKPQAALIVSNTFNDSFGALVSASYQERSVQINRIETAGWRPGQTISNANDGILFTNAYIPRNWDQIVDTQERTRTNVNLALQFTPTDELSVTVDGFVSQFEVNSLVTDLASWFEPDRVGTGQIDPATNTLVSFSQEIGLNQGSGDPATDFVSHTRNSRDSTTDGFGLNIEYAINDSLVASFDASTSNAENDRSSPNRIDRFNVVGIINNYTFDNTGSIPTVQHDNFGNGALPDPSLSRLHYNEQGNRFSDEDEISEYRLDFDFTPNSDVFRQMRFGAYRQEREKSSFQIFASQCAFCGYGTPAPNDTIGFRPFTAQNFFPGLIDTFYTYDGDAYVQFLADSGNPIEPTLQNNRYTINEDITSLYMDFTFDFMLGDMPLLVNAGARYAQTDISVGAVQSFISDVSPTTDLTLFQNHFGPAEDIVGSSDYANLLPSFTAKLDIDDTKVLRMAFYESMTRPTMGELSPATVFNEPRRQNLTASGGNPALEPFLSQNFDLSFEWYFDDASVASFAVFSKDVDQSISVSTGEEIFVMTDRLAPDFRCSEDNNPDCAPGVILDPNNPTLDVVATTEELNGETEVYTVARPGNGEETTITGFEAAITHIWESGFGFTANATVVDADADNIEGLGDSQNLIVFYEAERWQARVAYNNREGFRRLNDNGFNGEPVNTETFGQMDISASYDVTEDWTVFFEGINITEEELVQNGRFPIQTYNIEDNGSRFALGVRGRFD